MPDCRRHRIQWTGMSMAHCETCGLLFSTVNNFDRHRSGPVDSRECLTPAKSGLVEIRPGIWGQPGPVVPPETA